MLFLHQTKKVQAHRPQMYHGLKRWRPIFQQRWQPRWQPCHNFLHWEARPDFKEQTCQTKKQVWQHQRATKFGLPDYSTRSRGRVQRGRLKKGPKWLKASKNSVIPWKCLQFLHHKISSSHIEQEHSWEMLVTKSQNHPFCANLILRVFTVFSPGFRGFFIAFSKFFHGVTIFANLKGAPSIFQAWDICGGGTFLGIVSQKYDFKNNHIEKTSVLKT